MFATVAKPARPSNRGRKTKFSWDIIGAEVFRRLYEDGLPAPGEVTEFSDNVLQWCDGNLEKVPDLDALRKKIGIWLSRIPRSR
jgi:hypothetical protein